MLELFLISWLNVCSYFIPLALMTVFYYTAFYLPAKKQNSLLLTLKQGDLIQTDFGLIGTLIKVENEWYIIELENGAQAKITKECIARKL